MSKEKEKTSQRITSPVTEQDTVWACQVLDKVSEALDKVASKPEMLPDLFEELIKKTPDITEAFMYLTDSKFWPIIADLSKSWINLVRTWQTLRKQAKKP